MSEARDHVMAAVRAALARPEPPAAASAEGAEGASAAIQEGRESTTPEAPADLAARFARELEALAADLVSVPDIAGAITEVGNHLREIGAERIAAETRDTLTEAVTAGLEASGLTIARLGALEPAARRACLAEADTVITGADFGLAATGTLVCTAATLPDRIAAGLPRRHIAILPARNLVRDAATLLARHPEIARETLLFISGPSRTADVEKTLVLGAHGPAGLTVVLLATSRSA